MLKLIKESQQKKQPIRPRSVSITISYDAYILIIDKRKQIYEATGDKLTLCDIASQAVEAGIDFVDDKLTIEEIKLKQQCPMCQSFDTNEVRKIHNEVKWECNNCGRKWRIPISGI